MAQIGDFTKAIGEFLKAVDVKEGSVAVIIGEGKVVHNDKYDTDRLHIPVEMNGKEYTFDCSRTNARVISKTLGDITERWIGKSIVFEKYKTKTSDGKMTDALNIKEVRV